jgi:hypothetical protein
MTTEERTYITLNELSEIELTCEHEGCRVKFSWPIEKQFVGDDRCPGCNQEWFSDRDARKQHLKVLLKALSDLKSSLSGAKFDLRIRLNQNAA